MKKFTIPRKIPLIFVLFFLFYFPVHNQAQSIKRQCISSYGGSFMSNTVSVMQTAGQSFNTVSVFGATIFTLPGFQQPVVYKLGVISSPALNNLNITAYPNPAANFVTIQCKEPIENSYIRVSDIKGKMVLIQNFEKLQTSEINCTAWENGTYLIIVSDNAKNIKSFKLIINK